MDLLFEEDEDQELVALTGVDEDGNVYEAERIFGDESFGYQWEVEKKQGNSVQYGVSQTGTVNEYSVDENDSNVLGFIAEDIKETFEPL